MLSAVPAELHVADWHPAPERQIAVSLNGWVEFPVPNIWVLT